MTLLVQVTELFIFLSCRHHTDKAKREKKFMRWEKMILHPQSCTYSFHFWSRGILACVQHVQYSHCLRRCVSVIGKTPYPPEDHDGQLQNESRVRSASMRTSQHKLTFLQWRAFPAGYDLLWACSLGWFLSGKQSRSSADQPRT